MSPSLRIIVGIAALWFCQQSGVAKANVAAAAPAATVVAISPDDRTNQAIATSAIQQAIDHCASGGGGRVSVPQGEYQLTPLTLKSNVDLHLEKGATLHFSRKPDDYPMMWIDDGSGKEPGVQSPIYGDGLSNVSITGEGTIDGNGDAWRMVKRGKRTDEQWDALVKGGGFTNAKGTEWYPNAIVRDGREPLDKAIEANGTSDIGVYSQYRPLLRPNLVRLANCANVTLEGVTFSNSASWNVHLQMCDTITIKNITIFNDLSAQNGDGIDLDSCRDATMTGSTVNAGDDAICLKSGKDAYGRSRNRPTENVTITDCTIGTGHGGIVIGSEMSGGVRNVTVRDCTMNGTDNGLRFKSTRGRGGVVENINISNIKMTRIGGVAILFDLFYGSKATADQSGVMASESTPQFRNFHIRNITCESAGQALQLRGLPELPLQNMELTDITLTAEKPGLISQARGMKLTNVQVKSPGGRSVKVDSTADVTFDRCSGFDKQ